MPPWYGGQEISLVHLTSSRTKYPPMLPKLNRRRVQFVLPKIDDSIRQFFKFLPGEQRQAFLAQAHQKAS